MNILIKSDLFLIYKRNLLFYIFIFLLFVNVLFAFLYTRNNIVYPNENDVNHINSLNFIIHIMLENSIFTFNMISIFLAIILFDFKFFKIYYYKKISLKEVFLSKIVFLNFVLLFIILVFCLVNLVLGLILFDVSDLIFVYGKNEPISYFSFFVYVVKYYFICFCSFSLISSMTLFFYTIFSNKILTFSMILCFLIAQFYTPKFSIILHQAQFKKILFEDIYFYKTIAYLLLNFITIFISYFLFTIFREKFLFKICNPLKKIIQ